MPPDRTPPLGPAPREPHAPPATPLSVRPAEARDISGIATLIERYWEFESIPHFDRGRIERLIGGLLDQPSLGACWVAEDGRALQGYLVAVFMLSLEHGGVMAEIDEIYVSPASRSQGVGARLLDAAERDMASQGLLRLQLQLAADNAIARAFYERRGFMARSRYSLLDKALAPPA